MVLKVQDVCKSYSSRKALSRINFTLESGKITGLLGANGAGKSTLLKILSGYFFPSRGEAFLGETSLVGSPEEFRRMTGFLPEGAPLPPRKTPRQLLSSRYALYTGLDPQEEQMERILDRYGLSGEEGNKKMKTLSRGYRQRTGLALASLMNPPLLLLDEPFSGLDPSVIRKLRKLIREESQGRITFFSSHILQEIYALCDSLIILEKGEVRAELEMKDFKRWEELDDLYSSMIGEETSRD